MRQGRRAYLVHDSDVFCPTGRGRPRKNPLGIVSKHWLYTIARRACEDCINHILLIPGITHHLYFVSFIAIHPRIGYVRLVQVSSPGAIIFTLVMIVRADQEAVWG